MDLSVDRCVKVLHPVIQTRCSNMFSGLKMELNSILKYEAEKLLGVFLKKACHKIAVLFGRKDYKFIDRCNLV